MIKFKPSKNDFLEILSSKSSEIDAFIKKEKINFKDNQDLAKVFVYYGTLQFIKSKPDLISYDIVNLFSVELI